MSAAMTVDDKSVATLHCLLLYVDDVTKVDGHLATKNEEKFVNVVEWITLTQASDTSFKLDRVRRYVFFGALVSFNCQQSSFFLLQQPFFFLIQMYFRG